MPIIAEFIGTRLTAANLITGSGILRGFLISTAQVWDDVIFYDNTAASGTVLLSVTVRQEQVPFFIMFGRDDALRFDTGLSVEYTNCEVNVWAVQLS